ncbi:MAG: sigma-70 family RNA polymerase sigma factor [Oscillospiraceae bacterium]|nr:sigma-70 family RNA polymerase sigma factor [Oscillospiraceae bacterium]
METRYFEYNTNPADGKYTEVSEEQFIRDVMENKNRFYIPMGTVVFECTEKEFRRYRKERNHHVYLEKIEAEENVILLPINEEICEIPALEYSEEELIEKAYTSIQKEVLRKALQTLGEDERRLIHLRYYLEMTQEEIAELIGKTQQSISYEIGAVLNKLHKLLKN